MQQGAVPKALSTLSSLSRLSNRCPMQSVGPGIEDIKTTAVWSHVQKLFTYRITEMQPTFWKGTSALITLMNDGLYTMHAPPARYKMIPKPWVLKQIWTKKPPGSRVGSFYTKHIAYVYNKFKSNQNVMPSLGVRNLELFDGKLPPTGVMCVISGLMLSQKKNSVTSKYSKNKQR